MKTLNQLKKDQLIEVINYLAGYASAESCKPNVDNDKFHQVCRDLINNAIISVCERCTPHLFNY